MNELYLIMNDFLKSEYDLKALLSIISTLEAAYSEEEEQKIKFLASVVKGYLTAVEKEIRDTIGTLDNYIAQEAGKKSIEK